MGNNNIIINSKYAPGIATYGADGKQGKTGEAGYGLYFIPYNIMDLSNPSDDDNEYRQLVNSILNNKFITNNSYINIELLVMKDRSYQINDLFLLPSGQIYKLLDINAILQTVKFEKVGELIKGDQPFFIDNNIIINSDNMPVLLCDNYDGSQIVDAILTINYNKGNNKNLISFIDIDNNNKLNLTPTSDNGLLFDSSNLTYFNNVYVKYSDDALLNYGSYFKVVQESDIIVPKDFYTYTESTGVLTLYNLNTNCEIVFFKLNNDNALIERYVHLVTAENTIDPDGYGFTITDDMLAVELYIYSSNGYVAKYIKIK